MIMSIIHELRMVHGTNKKKAILKKHENNELWKAFLIATYNSSINYYIRGIADTTFITEDAQCYNKLFADIDKLTNKEYTGNMAKWYANELSEKYGEAFRLIIGGSIRSGVSITTINAVYKGLIPTFEVMLAKKDIEIECPALGSIKYDGVRIIVFVDDMNVTIKTRQGKLLQIDSLINDMQHFPNGVYDGELVHGNGKQSGRTKITGHVNRVLKGSLTDISDYMFCIIDKLTHFEWETQTCDSPFITRIAPLDEICVHGQHTMSVVQYNVDNIVQIESMFQWTLKNGYEGLIVRYPNDPYVWKRSSMLVKFKAINTAVLRCVAVLAGKGKYEGMIGALNCEGVLDNNKDVVVAVGTGLSDFDRDMMDSEYIGHYIEIEYNDIVKAKDVNYYSLFLPVFKRIRGMF